MKPPVLTKADWYRRSKTGEFGNRNPEWTRHVDWLVEGKHLCRLWGVRHTKIAGFPGTRLDVDREDVDRVILDGGFEDAYNISPMIHQFGTVVWEGDVTEEEALGHAFPLPGSWRTHMKRPDVWSGSARNALLSSVLNENSLDDLRILFDQYPGHVVELSALSSCFGTVPGRNAVIWEIRKY